MLRIHSDEINYRYLTYKLYSEGIREGFSISYHASLSQIKELSVVLSDIHIQNEAMRKLEILERKIQHAEEIIVDIQKGERLNITELSELTISSEVKYISPL